MTVLRLAVECFTGNHETRHPKERYYKVRSTHCGLGCSFVVEREREFVIYEGTRVYLYV